MACACTWLARPAPAATRWPGGGRHGRARRQGRAVLAAGPWQVRLLLVHPTKETRDEYRAWLLDEDKSGTGRGSFRRAAHEHTSSPFIWLNKDEYLGRVGRGG